MKEAIKVLSARIEKNKNLILTEEATKTAFIMPFLQILGYDVFNPLEVVPEFIADVGIKKGEKVDYAIVIDGSPVMLIECKPCNSDLSLDNEGQLLRYYHVTKAHFGILTNGIIYRFYADLEEPNKMDSTPFLEINLLNLDKIKFDELEKFHKSKFNVENIVKTADFLKCSRTVRDAVELEFANPSEDLVKMIFSESAPRSRFTPAMKNKFSPMVKAAIDGFINDRVNLRLSQALDSTAKEADEIAKQSSSLIEDDGGIETTVEEIEAYNIIRAIASEIVDPECVTMRDAKSYCAILFDDNNRRPICRFYFNNPERLSVGFFDGENEEKLPISKVSGLYKQKQRIINAVNKYIAVNADVK